MTAVERIKEALHLLELVDDEQRKHEGDPDFAWDIIQDAVYCQKIVNGIVWRCNKTNNPNLPEYSDVVSIVRCRDCKWYNASACFKDDGADNHRDPMDFCSRGERREP